MRVYAEGRQGRWLILPFLLILSPLSVMGRKKIDVFVAGFFPVGEGPKHSLGRGVMPALNLAVKHVNDHPTVLRNYKLHVIWNDTQCDTAVGTKLFFDMMYNKPAKLMLFGAACTHVTNPIAKAAKHWHIVQLSYADTHPMFNAIKYPNFFRMVPSDREFNHPRVHLLQRYNWTRVGTLFQNEPRHALAHNHLASMLEENSYQIEVTQNIADELKDQLKRLHEKDVRVILGYFDEHWARRIFCEAYRKGMYGKNYQWIITGMYREEWWALRGTGEEDEDAKPIVFEDEPRESGGGGCAVEDIMTALEGCIMTDLLPLSSSLERTVSGKNISEYEREYDSMRRSEYSRFHGYTYDGVWAMALAIQAVGHQLHRINHQNRTNLTVQDFTYRNPKWEELFTKALSEVKFEGVTGPVQFSSDNTRDGYILLKQFQGGREVKIGEFDGFRNVLQMDKGHPIYWPGGDPPLDRTVKLIEKTSVNITIYAILVTIASLGIVMASIFLAINIKYRNQRYIKMSSPYLNNVIIVGCILTYSSVILLGLDSGLASETSFPYICTARAWVLMAGFTLAFGSMFSKTWRVHSIFTDVQLNKKVIKDSQLFMVVLVLLCVDVAIMTTWQVVDPFYRETKKMAPFMRGDIEVTPENEYCKSNKISVFIGCIYAYKGLLMVFGCFLAWETRQVNIPALNDSKYIGMSVYNVVIMCVIGAPISYILSDEQDSSYLIISIFIIFCTTGTLTLVFVPKIIELRRNPQGNINQRLVRPTLKPPKSQDSDSELSDLHEQIKKAESDRQVFARRLHEREQELQILIDQLGEDALGEVETHPSRTSTRRPSKPRSIDRLRIEGPSITETTEATELTSLCSGGSHELEYVTARHKIPPHQLHPAHQPHSTSTTTITTTTTTAHHLLHHPHQPLPPPHYQASLPAHYMHGLPPPLLLSPTPHPPHLLHVSLHFCFHICVS
ncbi:gamma-aminobutyric acid type B receptor subunit 2-like isoform X1 [Scylla paramamosain]|uniref:gamma-aminobutyric acid type B receptor subunit 2-like isoform X1 n=2 Tax=Scylla paramamosain TaxID=85552 RepID=UPI003082AA26